jgi:hypothetical protein
MRPVSSKPNPDPGPDLGPARRARRDATEERRVTRALALLLGWYVVVGVLLYVAYRLARPQHILLIAAPVALVAAVIIAPTTLALLAQSKRGLRPLALATISALVGLAVVAVGVIIGYALR